MKTSTKILLILLTVTASQAHAAFVNSYKFSNWTKTINGGSITTSTAKNSVTLVSSNNGGGTKNQDFTIKADTASLVTFTWNFITKDKDGPSYDPFGWVLNGIFMQLTKNSGINTQTGTFSAKVNKGDLFGFRANSYDSVYGSATTVITNFSVIAQASSATVQAPSQVPVPAALWLMVVPMAGLGLFRKKA